MLPNADRPAVPCHLLVSRTRRNHLGIVRARQKHGREGRLTPLPSPRQSVKRRHLLQACADGLHSPGFVLRSALFDRKTDKGGEAGVRCSKASFNRHSRKRQLGETETRNEIKRRGNVAAVRRSTLFLLKRRVPYKKQALVSTLAGKPSKRKLTHDYPVKQSARQQKKKQQQKRTRNKQNQDSYFY